MADAPVKLEAAHHVEDFGWRCHTNLERCGAGFGGALASGRGGGSGEMTAAEFLVFNDAWMAAVLSYLCDGGSFDQLGLKRYDDIIFCTRSYLEAHRPVAVGFLRGFIKGIMDNSKDPKVAAELVVKKYGADYGLDLGQQTRENELMGRLTSLSLVI